MAESQKNYIQNLESRSVFCGDLHLKPGYPQELKEITIEELCEKYPAIKQKVEKGTIRMIDKKQADSEEKRISKEFKEKYEKAV